MIRRKTIFDVLREAEDDETTNTNSSSEDTSPSTNDNESSSENDSSNDNEESAEETTEDDYGKDEDFNIDTNLADSDQDTESDTSGDEDSGSTEPDTSSSTSDINNDEPIKANTDIFSSLSAEEQQIKIKELKRLFNTLYCSCDDTLVKINNIDTDENSIEIVTRLSSTIYNLKIYITDYITNLFSSKSYIENDVAFNRFLSILNSVLAVINDLVANNEEKLKN